MLRKTILFLLICSATVMLSAQLSKGIKGKVLDRDGKPVPDVTVTFVDQSNAQNKYEIKTDKDGLYLYAGLPYSSDGYKVSVKVGDLPEVPKLTKVKTLEMVEIDFDMRTDIVMQETKTTVVNHAANAQDLYNNGDYQGALGEIEEALKSEEKSNEKAVLFMRIGCFGKMDRKDEQLEACLKFQELYPKSEKEKEVAGILADLYRDKGDKANAEKYTKLYKELGGLVTAENYNEGVSRLNAGDAEGAAEFFRKAIADDANDADAHRELASALARTGDFGGAVEHLKIYLKLKPDADDANQWKEAIKQLEPMVKGSKGK